MSLYHVVNGIDYRALYLIKYVLLYLNRILVVIIGKNFGGNDGTGDKMRYSFFVISLIIISFIYLGRFLPKILGVDKIRDILICGASGARIFKIKGYEGVGRGRMPGDKIGYILNFKIFFSSDLGYNVLSYLQREN